MIPKLEHILIYPSLSVSPAKLQICAVSAHTGLYLNTHADLCSIGRAYRQSQAHLCTGGIVEQTYLNIRTVDA